MQYIREKVNIVFSRILLFLDFKRDFRNHLRHLKEKQILELSLKSGTEEFKTLSLLGDTILKQEIYFKLHSDFPKKNRGEINEIGMSIVSNSNLIEVGNYLNLEEVINHYGKKKAKKLNADVIEAILAELNEKKLYCFIKLLIDAIYEFSIYHKSMESNVVPTNSNTLSKAC